MEKLNIPQMEWIREYLTEHFPGQALPERAVGLGTVVIDVTSSDGLPKELRISRSFFRFSKTSIQEYLKNAKIAENIETAPTFTSIDALL
ncbi:MAG: hypothetical protein ACLQPN_11105 [Bryobacteraceae bacterium]